MVTAIVTTIALVLMISGIILKQGLFLIAATLSWIFFAFLMFDYTFTNAAINDGLLVFGGFMAILCAFIGLNIFMSNRPKRALPEADYEAYKKKVLDVTRRR